MTREVIHQYLKMIVSDESVTPAIINEEDIFLILSEYTKKHLISYEEIAVEGIENISIYDIPEDKKEFNIETVRNFLGEIDLRPYQGKHFYILRHFDTATLQAQNAVLKILEEPPEYAIILLEVINGNAILDTIKSRTINLTQSHIATGLSEIGKQIISLFIESKQKELITLLYGFKCDSSEAILILQGVYPYLNEEKMRDCLNSIEELSNTHENPRSILDSFFI